MKTDELKNTLCLIVATEMTTSVMIWGAPGIGKSSIVKQVAEEADLQIVDLRISQLAPTDLRGLPVAEDGTSRWFPPEFLPREGKGILFLDEINLAPPAMQGMAQQLILDRRVGSYQVPNGWFVWAAGNRKEDRGSTFDMPAPLANRFLHFHVEADLDTFTTYALKHRVHEQVLAFLSFRPALLYKLDPQQPAWPSPRSWMMASRLLHMLLADISSAVGNATATEFFSFLKLQEHLPSVPSILAGDGDEIEFPSEMSIRYALLNALITSAKSDVERGHAWSWVARKAPAEFTQAFIADLDKRELTFTVPNDQRLVEPLKTMKEILS